MKSKVSLTNLLSALIAPILSVCAAVFCVLLFLRQSDLINIDNVYESMLFKRGVLLTLFIALCAAAAIVFAAFAFITRKNLPTYDSPLQKSVLLFPRAAAGLFLLITLILQFKLSTANTPYDLTGWRELIAQAPNFFKVSSQTRRDLVLLFFKYLSLGFTLPASAYFLIPVFVDKKNVGKLRAVLGFFLVARLALELLLTHFFPLDFLNSPTRVLRILAVCFLVFFFLAEMHCFLEGRPAVGAHTALGMAAGFFAVTDGAAKSFLSFAHKAGFSMNISAFYSFAILALGVYALAVSFTQLYEAKKAPVPAKSESGESVPAPVAGTGTGSEDEAETEIESEAEIETGPEIKPETEPENEKEDAGHE